MMPTTPSARVRAPRARARRDKARGALRPHPAAQLAARMQREIGHHQQHVASSVSMRDRAPKSAAAWRRRSPPPRGASARRRGGRAARAAARGRARRRALRRRAARQGPRPAQGRDVVHGPRYALVRALRNVAAGCAGQHPHAPAARDAGVAGRGSRAASAFAAASPDRAAASIVAGSADQVQSPARRGCASPGAARSARCRPRGAAWHGVPYPARQGGGVLPASRRAARRRRRHGRISAQAAAPGPRRVRRFPHPPR